MLAFLRETAFGPLIADLAGYRAQGVRRLEDRQPTWAAALERTVGDYSKSGCLTAVIAAADLYRLLRHAVPTTLDIRAEAERASREYVVELSKAVRGNAVPEGD